MLIRTTYYVASLVGRSLTKFLSRRRNAEMAATSVTDAAWTKKFQPKYFTANAFSKYFGENTFEVLSE